MLKFLQVAKILKIIQLVLTPPRLFHWLSFVLFSFMLGSLGVINSLFKPADSLNRLLFNAALICLMIAISWRTNQPPFRWGKFSLSPLLSTIFISIFLYNNLPGKLQNTAIILIPILYLCLTLVYEIFNNKGKINQANLSKPNFFIYLLSTLLFSCWLGMHFLVNDWLDEYPSFRHLNMDNSNFVIRLDKLDARRRNSRNQSSPLRGREQLPNNQLPNNQRFNNQGINKQDINNQISNNQLSNTPIFNPESFIIQSNNPSNNLSNNLSGNLSNNRLGNNQSVNQLISQLPDQYFGAKILNELETVLRDELAQQQSLSTSVNELELRIISNFDQVKKNFSNIKESKFWEFAPPEVVSSPANLSYDVVFKLRWKGPKLEENDFYLTKKCTIQSSLKSFLNRQNTVGAIDELPLLAWDKDFYSNSIYSDDNNQLPSNNSYKFTLVSQRRKPPVLGPGCPDPNQPTTDQHGKPLPESQLKRSLSNCEKPVQPIPPKPHIPRHKPIHPNHRPVNEFTAYCSNPNISDLSKKLRQCPQFASPYNSHNNAEKLKKIYSGWNNQDLPRQDINNNSRLNNPNNLPGINNPNNLNNLPGINNQNRGNFNRPNPPNNPSNNQTNKEPLSLTFPRLPKFIKDFIDFLNDYFQIDQSNNPNNSPNNNPNNPNPDNLNNNNSQIGNNPNNLNNPNNPDDNLALPINTNIIKCKPIKKEIISNTTE
jgi:hypothetical protein